ncbi:MAG TPA: hypothetical protein EYN89_14275 [Flavobacteriales bacterium]|nr:hypothetical protein [Flavobacteriales bacterium]
MASRIIILEWKKEHLKQYLIILYSLIIISYISKQELISNIHQNVSNYRLPISQSISKTYLANKVLYAEYFAKKIQNKKLFVRLLTEVKDADPKSIPELHPEQTFEQKKAHTMLSKLEDYFE